MKYPRKFFFYCLWLVACFCSMPLSAQNLRATYSYYHTQPDGYTNCDMDMQLDCFDGSATFYSENTFLKDSLLLIATDKNGAIVNDDAYYELTNLPPASTKEFTEADYPSGAFVQHYYYPFFFFSGTGKLEMPQWEIEDTTAEISGYQCQKAQADYLGRRWTVWFCKDVPCIAGPWLLWGAPGIIVDARDSEKQIIFRLRYLEPLADNNRGEFMRQYYRTAKCKQRFAADIRQIESLYTKLRINEDFQNEMTRSKTEWGDDAEGQAMRLRTFSYNPLIPREYWDTH